MVRSLSRCDEAERGAVGIGDHHAEALPLSSEKRDARAVGRPAGARRSLGRAAQRTRRAAGELHEHDLRRGSSRALGARHAECDVPAVRRELHVADAAQLVEIGAGEGTRRLRRCARRERQGEDQRSERDGANRGPEHQCLSRLGLRQAGRRPACCQMASQPGTERTYARSPTYFDAAARRRISPAMVRTRAPSFAPATSLSTCCASAFSAAARAAPPFISAMSRADGDGCRSLRCEPAVPHQLVEIRPH